MPSDAPTRDDALDAAYQELERLLACGAPVDAKALAERTGARLEEVLDLQAALAGFARAFDDSELLPPGDRLELASGLRVGKYTLGEELGRGGMGVVYRAQDALLDRAVAIKFAAPARCTLNQRLLDRFLREARALAQLRHPGIVAVVDRGEHEGVPYFVMDFVPGESLRARLDREGTLPQWAAASLCQDLAEALALAHEHGLLHRDVKPANVMLGPDDVPVLMDFGLVRLLGQEDGSLTLAGSVVGTATYMAPEQARGAAEIDARADVYALGAVLYRTLVGSAPFVAEGVPVGGVLAAKQERRPRPVCELAPGVDPALAAVCMRCLAPKPEARYATAAELGADLERALTGQRPRAAPRRASGRPAAGPGRVVRPRSRPRPAQPKALALLAPVLLLGLLGLWSISRSPSPEPSEPPTSDAVSPPPGRPTPPTPAPPDEIATVDTGAATAEPAQRAPKPPAAPRVTVTAPAPGALLRAGFVLEGHVSAPLARVVSVNGRDVPLNDDGSFSVAIAPRGSDGPFAVDLSVPNAQGDALRLSHSLAWDATPPTLFLTDWDDGRIVRKATARVQGRLEDAHPPSDLTIADSRAEVDADGRFGAEVALSEGPNTISVRGVDQAGNAFSRDLKVTRDSTPPALDVTDLPQVLWKGARLLRVEWRVDDLDCTTTADLGGAPLVVTRKRDAFRAKARLQAGDNRITVCATDRAGNTTSVSQLVRYNARGRPPKGTWWEPTKDQLSHAARRKARLWFQNTLGMRFALIPPGRFLMGGPADVSWKDDNVEPHSVTLTAGFYLCATEVTNEQLRALSPRHDSGSAHGLTLNDPTQPAAGVTWTEAQLFCTKLSQGDPEWSYRLPSEAEWEYACRAGSTSLYPWGDDAAQAAALCNLRDAKSETSLGWERYGERGDDDGHRVSAPVGTRYPPNAWGLFDMSGNVGEWVGDRYVEALREDARDPMGPADGTRRVRRGGSWSNTVDYCRSGFRKGYEPQDTDNNRGFRLVAVRKGR